MTSSPRLVIFDMDGTLTRPALDFDRIRAEIGITSGTILEALESMLPDERPRAIAIIEAHERIAARDSELQDGVREVLEFLRRNDICVAIATRNSRQSVQTVLEKHDLVVDYAHSRDDGAVKPSPQPVLNICKYLSVAPEETWMVGDYEYDIQSGNSAGATTVLLIAGEVARPCADQANHVIRSLRELMAVLDNGEMQ